MSYNNYYEQPRPAHDDYDYPPHRPMFRSWKVTDTPVLCGKPKEPEPYKPFQRRGKRLARHNAMLAARNSSSDEDTTSSFQLSLEDTYNRIERENAFQTIRPTSAYQLSLEDTYNRIERENAFQVIQPQHQPASASTSINRNIPETDDIRETLRALSRHLTPQRDLTPPQRDFTPPQRDLTYPQRNIDDVQPILEHSPEPEMFELIETVEPVQEQSSISPPEIIESIETAEQIPKQATTTSSPVEIITDEKQHSSTSPPHSSESPKTTEIVPTNSEQSTTPTTNSPKMIENVPADAEQSMNRRLLTTLESILDARHGIERLEEKVSSNKMSEPATNNAYIRVAIDINLPFSKPSWDIDWRWLRWIGMLLMFFLGWLFLETFMCAVYCKPQYSSTGRYKNSDPIFYYALPWKLDEWTGNTISRAWRGFWAS